MKRDISFQVPCFLVFNGFFGFPRLSDLWKLKCLITDAVHSDKLISHTLFALCHTMSEGVNFVTMALFSWTTYFSTFRASFILKLWIYMENVCINKNVNSEWSFFVCGHHKMGMCIACPKECRNTVFYNILFKGIFFLFTFNKNI
jgi:hypothetical protein